MCRISDADSEMTAWILLKSALACNVGKLHDWRRILTIKTVWEIQQSVIKGHELEGAWGRCKHSNQNLYVFVYDSRDVFLVYGLLPTTSIP
jgi:hypothetical protein